MISALAAFPFGTTGLLLLLAAFVLIAVVFGKYLSDILYETVVDGGLSFLDEILGIGTIPGLDIGDYLASVIMWRREVQQSGYFSAFVAALEASNFIIFSFIPGADYITNIFPITPFLRAISAFLSQLAPDSTLFKGTMQLSHEKYDKCQNMIMDIQTDVNVDRAKGLLKKAKNSMTKRKNFSKALKQAKQAIKSVNDNTNDYIDKQITTFNNKVQRYLKDQDFMQFLIEQGFTEERYNQISDKFQQMIRKAREYIKQGKIRQGLDQAKQAFREMNFFEKQHKAYALVRIRR